MGIGGSAEMRQQRKEHNRIEEILATDKEGSERIQKLLLLGAAECGKSTILKQMRIIHDSGFTAEEVHLLRRVIRENIVEAMRTMISGRIVREQPKFIDYIGERMFTVELYDALKQLWADQSIQEVYSHRAAFHLLDSTKYFLDDLDRIAAEKYEPNNQDVLCIRSPTTGVTEMKFTANRVNFRIYDVGGQRSERRKWIQCFDNVNGIIFLSAISEFDQKLVENNETNRLLESLSVFKQVVNNKLFAVSCSMILFLNKTDLFAQKIIETSINIAFLMYKRARTYEEQIKFIQKQFESQNDNPKKKLYVHRTCATDTKQVEAVIGSVLASILANNMKEMGIQ